MHQYELTDPVLHTYKIHTTMNRNGNFGLVLDWGGNATQIHDFCIPLDFLGIKDLKKNKKGQIFFQRPQLHLLKFYNFFALCGLF